MPSAPTAAVAQELSSKNGNADRDLAMKLVNEEVDAHNNAIAGKGGVGGGADITASCTDIATWADLTGSDHAAANACAPKKHFAACDVWLKSEAQQLEMLHKLKDTRDFSEKKIQLLRAQIMFVNQFKSRVNCSVSDDGVISCAECPTKEESDQLADQYVTIFRHQCKKKPDYTTPYNCTKSIVKMSKTLCDMPNKKLIRSKKVRAESKTQTQYTLDTEVLDYHKDALTMAKKEAAETELNATNSTTAQAASRSRVQGVKRRCKRRFKRRRVSRRMLAEAEARIAGLEAQLAPVRIDLIVETGADESPPDAVRAPPSSIVSPLRSVLVLGYTIRFVSNSKRVSRRNARKLSDSNCLQTNQTMSCE